MNWTLEVVTVPVSDLAAAIAFYRDRVGFALDHEFPGMAQLTPPGSGCSVVLSTGGPMAPGTLKGVQLVVNDVRAARAELAGRGVEVSDVRVFAPDGLRDATADDDLNNAGFVFFDDPDGNGWAVQQITARP